MSLFDLDDHYNQERYRYERDKCVISTRQSGQRRNYPFLFNRQVTMFYFNTQHGHKNEWFIGEKKCPQ